jgi:hypothetical protein
MSKFESEWDTQRTDPYDGFLHRTRADAEKIASLKGCTVREPAPDQLFLDIDSEEQAARCRRLIATMDRTGLIADRPRWSPSPSGEPGHYHVVVDLSRNVVDMRERILLQALLGSDPMRELLSWRRLEDGAPDDAISLFFERIPGTEIPAPERGGDY